MRAESRQTAPDPPLWIRFAVLEIICSSNGGDRFRWILFGGKKERRKKGNQREETREKRGGPKGSGQYVFVFFLPALFCYPFLFLLSASFFFSFISGRNCMGGKRRDGGRSNRYGGKLGDARYVFLPHHSYLSFVPALLLSFLSYLSIPFWSFSYFRISRPGE